MTDTPTLYGSALSPFVERVCLTLDIKGATDEVTMGGVPGGSPASDDYRRINPVGKMPCLAVGDTMIVESRAIIAYFDRLYPTPPLVPDAPLAAAKSELIAQLVDNYLSNSLRVFFGLSERKIFAGDEVETAKADLGKNLDDLEHFFGTDSFVTGDTWTVGDVVLLPAMFFATRLDGLFNLGVLDGREKLATWYQNTVITPTGTQSHQRQQEALDAYMVDAG